MSRWAKCFNEKAGYEFYYPDEWSVYGEGSMGDDGPFGVRTTPCDGYGVALVDVRNHGETGAGITIRVDPIYPLPCRNSLGESILLDEVQFCVVPQSDGTRQFIGIHEGRVTTLTTHVRLSEKTLKRLLSTFRLID